MNHTSAFILQNYLPRAGVTVQKNLSSKLYFDHHAKFGYFFSYFVRACVTPKKFLARLTLTFRMGACLKHPYPTCYRAKFGRSNHADISRGSQRFWERCLLNIRDISESSVETDG